MVMWNSLTRTGNHRVPVLLPVDRNLHCWSDSWGLQRWKHHLFFTQLRKAHYLALPYRTISNTTHIVDNQQVFTNKPEQMFPTDKKTWVSFSSFISKLGKLTNFLKNIWREQKLNHHKRMRAEGRGVWFLAGSVDLHSCAVKKEYWGLGNVAFIRYSLLNAEAPGQFGSL